MLKANGKFIDTAPLQWLFSQEEAWVDQVTITVDRYHGEHDLAEFLFVMRGVTEGGGEAEAVLRKGVGEKTIRLTWEVSPKFTAEAGTLRLDLFAYRYEDSDPGSEKPDYLLRYQLPPVQVRGLPEGDHVPPEQSYTAFLVNVRETAQTAIRQLTEDRAAALAALTEVVDDYPPIVILLQSEYDAILNKDPGTLYVIKDSVTELS